MKLYIFVFVFLISFFLQSYASILYLRLPPGFRIILRGVNVEHHNIENDMMLAKEMTYRPQIQDGIWISKNPNVMF